MSAGYFIRTYELWRKITTVDDFGQRIETWEKQADIYGRAYKASLRDVTAAGVADTLGVVIWTFACHPDNDVQIADEIRFDDHRLTIESIVPTSRGDRLECRCKETQGGPPAS